MTVPIDFDVKTNTATAGGQSLLFHCHYYNCALQHSIEQGMGAQGMAEQARALLVDNARTVVAAQLSELLAEQGEHAATRPGEGWANALELGCDLFRQLGFGALDLGTVAATGGEAIVSASHYAMGWVAVYGERSEPVCRFAEGYIAAAVMVAYGVSADAVRVREHSCYANGHEQCRFGVEVQS